MLDGPESFSKISNLILSKKESRIVVVLSAMRGMTDQLIELAQNIHPNPPRREMDMLISVGERISIALLAMALHTRGKEAVSFTGSQSGIITTTDHSDAKIIDVRPFRLIPPLREGKIVIVAGFQGVSIDKDITTLGRGGSDTTAVALGIALGAKRVEFIKDVGGIYSHHPQEQEAEKMRELTHERALEIVKKTGGVLHPRAIELAMKNGLTLYVSGLIELGTVIRSESTTKDACYETSLSSHYNAI